LGLPRHDDLVARAQAGDAAAFDALVDESYALVYSTALRLTGDPELAADATQDAYVRAYNSLAGFRGQSAFTTWLYRIAVNVCLDHLRRRTRQPRSLPTAGTNPEDTAPLPLAAAAPTPQQETERHERQRLVQEALLRLSDDHRTVLVLFDLSGLTYEEIAQVTGVPLGTVKSRLNRARLALRDELGPHLELFDPL